MAGGRERTVLCEDGEQMTQLRLDFGRVGHSVRHSGPQRFRESASGAMLLHRQRVRSEAEFGGDARRTGIVRAQQRGLKLFEKRGAAAFRITGSQDGECLRQEIGRAHV